MKKKSQIVLGIFVISMSFLVIYPDIALANHIDIKSSGTCNGKVQAHNRTTYCFQERTRITINCSVNCDIKIECEAMKIGIKYFELEIEAGSDLQINMTCKEEESQLGLIKGNAYTARNRNRYQYQEGICIKIQTNGTFTQAKLKIQATNQNRLSTWAYYDESIGQWVTVTTEEDDGYLVTITDHFSTWTLLLPEVDNFPLIVAGISVFAGLIGIIALGLYFKRR